MVFNSEKEMLVRLSQELLRNYDIDPDCNDKPKKLSRKVKAYGKQFSLPSVKNCNGKLFSNTVNYYCLVVNFYGIRKKFTAAIFY